MWFSLILHIKVYNLDFFRTDCFLATLVYILINDFVIIKHFIEQCFVIYKTKNPDPAYMDLNEKNFQTKNLRFLTMQRW